MKRRVYIIEDEALSRSVLCRLLEKHFPDLEVAGTAESVEEAVALLKAGMPDLIFMDIQLADGDSFDIFTQVDVRCHVVMTTAYDSYAVQAFEAGSIDYLVKPVDLPALQRAVERCRQYPVPATDIGKTLRMLQERDRAREPFLIHYNDHIVSLKQDEILCLYTFGGKNRVALRDGTVYPVDASLDTLAAELDAGRFFRISRSCIVSKDDVASAGRVLGGRLRLQMKALPATLAHQADFTVSRARVDAFLDWLSH
ncbi:MAG: response regulator transcription factor [Bacteroidales bacterium]|nr:response regulator transcription factor [Bacteroidales bacterium]